MSRSRTGHRRNAMAAPYHERQRRPDYFRQPPLRPESLQGFQRRDRPEPPESIQSIRCRLARTQRVNHVLWAILLVLAMAGLVIVVATGCHAAPAPAADPLPDRLANRPVAELVIGDRLRASVAMEPVGLDSAGPAVRLDLTETFRLDAGIAHPEHDRLALTADVTHVLGGHHRDPGHSADSLCLWARASISLEWPLLPDEQAALADDVSVDGVSLATIGLQARWHTGSVPGWPGMGGLWAWASVGKRHNGPWQSAAGIEFRPLGFAALYARVSVDGSRDACCGESGDWTGTGGLRLSLPLTDQWSVSLDCGARHHAGGTWSSRFGFAITVLA